MAKSFKDRKRSNNSDQQSRWNNRTRSLMAACMVLFSPVGRQNYETMWRTVPYCAVSWQSVTSAPVPGVRGRQMTSTAHQHPAGRRRRRRNVNTGAGGVAYITLGQNLKIENKNESLAMNVHLYSYNLPETKKAHYKMHCHRNQTRNRADYRSR